MGNSKWISTNNMNQQTRKMLSEIRMKYKDQVTKKPAFKNDEEVKDFGIEILYNQLKQERLIWK